jgi:hypothetical protein
MTPKITMTLADAAAFQNSFDAVEAGTATAAQLAEAQAVIIAVVHYTRDIGALADAQAKGRKAMLASLDEGRKAKVMTALDGKAIQPLLWWDNEAKTLVTPESEAEVDAAKEAARAPAPLPEPLPSAPAAIEEKPV